MTPLTFIDIWLGPRCVTFQGKISFLAKISAPSNLNLVDLFIGTNFGKIVIKIVFNRFSVSTRIECKIL